MQNRVDDDRVKRAIRVGNLFCRADLEHDVGLSGEEKAELFDGGLARVHACAVAHPRSHETEERAIARTDV